MNQLFYLPTNLNIKRNLYFNSIFNNKENNKNLNELVTTCYNQKLFLTNNCLILAWLSMPRKKKKKDSFRQMTIFYYFEYFSFKNLWSTLKTIKCKIASYGFCTQIETRLVITSFTMTQSLFNNPSAIRMNSIDLIIKRHSRPTIYSKNIFFHSKWG